MLGSVTLASWLPQVFETLYGKHAAALYAQAADFNKTARFYYMKAQVKSCSMFILTKPLPRFRTCVNAMSL
jgi:hypothetical protein